MSRNDIEQWQRNWRQGDTDFHRLTVNRHLQTVWPTLAVPPSAKIFVPLCGKSLDMLWLARQGHHVIGIELSPVAIRAFFRESRVQPERRQAGKFTSWQRDRIQILCGDFFDLHAADLENVAMVYDHASLTALPEELRADYVRHLRAILPDAAMLLVTTEDLESHERGGFPYAVTAEVESLYGEHFAIDLRHAESLNEDDPAGEPGAVFRVEEKTYLLTPRERMATLSISKPLCP